MSPTRHPLIPVVEAIAEVEGVDPLELGYSLHEHVDTDAIQGLVEGGYEGWELAFQVPGHDVVLRADDGVYVDGGYVRPLGSARSRRVE